MTALKLTLFLLCVVAIAQATAVFNPREYSKKTAICRASRRGLTEETVDIHISTFIPVKCLGTNADDEDLSLEYVDINPTASETLLMVHGWPGLWSTWSRQILGFKVSNIKSPLQMQMFLTIPNYRMITAYFCLTCEVSAIRLIQEQ